MSSQMPEAGDRYEWDGCRVTVSSIDEARTIAQLRVYDPETMLTRFLYQDLPLPDSFERTGGPTRQCVRCLAAPQELGMVYCVECVDVLAATWTPGSGVVGPLGAVGPPGEGP